MNAGPLIVQSDKTLLLEAWSGISGQFTGQPAASLPWLLQSL